MKESTLYHWISRSLPQAAWTRIESGFTQRGIPDLVGMYDGRTAWIELKQGLPRWSPWQRSWATKAARVGVRVFVISIRYYLFARARTLDIAVWDARRLFDAGNDLTEVKLTWDNASETFVLPRDADMLRHVLWQ